MPYLCQVLAPRLAMLIAVAALVAAGAPARADGAPGSEPIEEFRHYEARLAMGAQNFERARRLYQIILRTSPNDALAQRESGRAAHALGLFEIAIDDLRRADQLQGARPDPELHYLLGEALYALGRTAEARAEQDLAAEQIGDEPTERMASLWLARIHARNGHLDRAEPIYERLAGGELDDEEVIYNWTEARILCGDWAGAEQLLREFIRKHRDADRAREMLAWVLEARGEVAEERALRAELAEEADDTDFTRVVSHARSLERSGDYDGALSQYRQAYRIDPEGAPELRASIDRMQYRLTPEVGVGVQYQSDPSGSSQEVHTGIALPIGSEFALALGVAFGTADGDRAAMRKTSGGTATIALATGYGRDLSAVFRVSGNYRELTGPDLAEDERANSIGAGVEARIAEGRAIQGHVRADLHMPWREAANTIREGGVYDGITAQAYALPFGHQLIFGAGVRARQMAFHPLMDGTEATGSQVLGFGGVDWVPWADPTSAARGQILDEELAWPTYLADSLVLSYRHYEVSTDDDFGDRLVLAERDSVDELSSTARKAMADGVLALELRGGLGYDWAREMMMWRAGGALLVSPSVSSRLSLSIDSSRESTEGFVGRRHAGWLSFHVDL